MRTCKHRGCTIKPRGRKQRCYKHRVKRDQKGKGKEAPKKYIPRPELDNLTGLPYEILFEIAVNLNFSDLMSACKTSKRMNKICSESYFKLKWLKKQGKCPRRCKCLHGKFDCKAKLLRATKSGQYSSFTEALWYNDKLELFNNDELMKLVKYAHWIKEPNRLKTAILKKLREHKTIKARKIFSKVSASANWAKVMKHKRDLWAKNATKRAAKKEELEEGWMNSVTWW